MRNNNNIRELHIIRDKKVLNEKLIIDYKRDFKLICWKFVRTVIIDMLYSVIIRNAYYDERELVDNFFNNLTSNNVHDIEDVTITKSFKIHRGDVIINDDNIRLDNDIDVSISVTAYNHPKYDVDGEFEPESNTVILYCGDLISDKYVKRAVLENKNERFIEEVNSIYPTLIHELIHAVKENSSMSILISPSSFKYNSKEMSRMGYYYSRDAEYETMMFSTFSEIKKKIVKSKKRMPYSYFFKSLPSQDEFLSSLKHYRKNRFVSAIHELFDLLKKDYLVDDGFDVQRWIDAFKKHE